MLCQNCGKQNFTLKITRIRDGVAEEVKVCEDCALQISPYHAKIAKKKNLDKTSVENLLKDLLSKQEVSGALEEVLLGSKVVDLSATCGSCGLDFQRYKQTYMLGCPECYDSFGERLLSDIQRIHGATEHVAGKTSGTVRRNLDTQARSRALRQELEECLDSEDYARAARIRDELRKLQEAEESGASDATAGEGDSEKP